MGYTHHWYGFEIRECRRFIYTWRFTFSKEISFKPIYMNLHFPHFMIESLDNHQRSETFLTPIKIIIQVSFSAWPNIKFDISYTWLKAWIMTRAAATVSSWTHSKQCNKHLHVIMELEKCRKNEERTK